MANLVVGPFLGPVGIGGPDRLREYLEGSHFRVEPWNPIFAWRAWKRSRRLILGLYGTPGSNDVRLQRLIEAGFAPAGRVGTDQFGVTIAWFDKNGIC